MKSKESEDLKEDPELSMANRAGEGSVSGGGDDRELLVRIELIL